MDDQGVQDGKNHDRADPQEDLRDHQVGLEHIGVRYVNVLYGLPSTFSHIGQGQAGGVGAEAPEDHLVLEAEGDVEEDASDEAEGDVDRGVLESVYPLEVGRLVDRYVPRWTKKL